MFLYYMVLQINPNYTDAVDIKKCMVYGMNEGGLTARCSLHLISYTHSASVIVKEKCIMYEVR